MTPNIKYKMPDMVEWRKNRYARFNAKIDALREHPKYEWLRKYADDAMVYNEGGGYFMIKAEDFIDRIETMEVAFIQDWLDGKNGLKRDEYNAWLSLQEEHEVSLESKLSDAVERSACAYEKDEPLDKELS